MGFLAALGGAGGAAGGAGATGAGAGVGASATAAAPAVASAAAPTGLMGAAPATSAAGPATAMSAFSGMGTPGTALGAGNAGGLMQQILQGMSQYGGGVINPGKGQAGQNVFGSLNQGNLPKFSDAAKYATQLALNDLLFGRRKERGQDFSQYYQGARR